MNSVLVFAGHDKFADGRCLSVGLQHALVAVGWDIDSGLDQHPQQSRIRPAFGSAHWFGLRQHHPVSRIEPRSCQSIQGLPTPSLTPQFSSELSQWSLGWLSRWHPLQRAPAFRHRSGNATTNERGSETWTPRTHTDSSGLLRAPEGRIPLVGRLPSGRLLLSIRSDADSHLLGSDEHFLHGHSRIRGPCHGHHRMAGPLLRFPLLDSFTFSPLDHQHQRPAVDFPARRVFLDCHDHRTGGHFDWHLPLAPRGPVSRHFDLRFAARNGPAGIQDYVPWRQHALDVIGQHSSCAGFVQALVPAFQELFLLQRGHWQKDQKIRIWRQAGFRNLLQFVRLGWPDFLLPSRRFGSNRNIQWILSPVHRIQR